MRQFQSLDELKTLIGQVIGVSDWFLVDQERVNSFADATEDHQWIHVDVERAAREMPCKSTIVHGYLTLSLLPMFMSQIMTLENISMGINYGANKVRFINMVPVGARLRARMVLKAADPKGAGLMVANEITVEIEGEAKPALIAETLSLYYP